MLRCKSSKAPVTHAECRLISSVWPLNRKCTNPKVQDKIPHIAGLAVYFAPCTGTKLWLLGDGATWWNVHMVRKQLATWLLRRVEPATAWSMTGRVTDMPLCRTPYATPFICFFSLTFNILIKFNVKWHLQWRLDIDECSENGRICLNGQCVNEPGSYKCICSPGYQLSPDGAFCLGKCFHLRTF